MVVFGVYIVSKSGGLIFNHDHNTPKVDTEKVFNYPVDLKLDFDAKNIIVVFGQRDGINGRFRPLPEISTVNAFITPHNEKHVEHKYSSFQYSLVCSWTCVDSTERDSSER